MGLEALQRMLSRLWTDAALRERFRADPRGTARAEGLDEDEAARVATDGVIRQVEEFARALVEKRCGEVMGLLPRTARVLGPGFRARFRTYAAAGAPQGVRKHRADAVGFAAELSRAAARGEPGFPPWLGELARYEASWLEASDPTRRLIVRRFRVPIPMLADAIRRGESPGVPAARGTWCVWWRLTPASPGRFASW